MVLYEKGARWNQVRCAEFPAALTQTIPAATALSTVFSGLMEEGEVPSPGPSNNHVLEWLMTDTP